MNLSKLSRAAAAMLIGLLFLTGSAVAQTATTTTTLASAVSSASITQVSLASATGVAAGSALYIDREYMDVTSVSGTIASVIRGSEGTAATTHGSGAIVYVATKAQKPYVFRAYDPAGSCTAASQQYLPQINTSNGAVWDCQSAVGLWVNQKAFVEVECRTGVLATGSIDQSCFIADRPYVVVAIREVHAVAESAGTLTLIPRRQQSTEAPASGDSLVAAAIDMVGAGAVAQTVKTPALTATPSLLLLSAGERLGLDFTDDVAGELAGVVVQFTLYPR